MDILVTFQGKAHSSYEEVKTVVIIKASQVQLDLTTGTEVGIIIAVINNTALVYTIVAMNYWG